MNTEIWNLFNEINNSYVKDNIADIVDENTSIKIKKKCFNCNESDFLMID